MVNEQLVPWQKLLLIKISRPDENEDHVHVAIDKQPLFWKHCEHNPISLQGRILFLYFHVFFFKSQHNYFSFGLLFSFRIKRYDQQANNMSHTVENKSKFIHFHLYTTSLKPISQLFVGYQIPIDYYYDLLIVGLIFEYY